jgi:hypothetical protein
VGRFITDCFSSFSTPGAWASFLLPSYVFFRTNSYSLSAVSPNLLLLCFPAEHFTTMSSSEEPKDFDSNQQPAEDGSTADGSNEDFNQELHRTLHPTTVLRGDLTFSGDTAPGSLQFEEGLFMSSSAVDDAETPPLPAFLMDTQIREALARATTFMFSNMDLPPFLSHRHLRNKHCRPC